MFRALAFGKGFGGTSVVLGVLGAGGASLLLGDSGSVPGAMIGVFALIVFHIALGWKVYSLSREPVSSFGEGGKAVLFGGVNAEQQSARASKAARITDFTEETR